MCCKDILEMKFGRQPVDYGIGNAQKSLNGFEHTVYYPTNWRGSYQPLMGKFPEFVRYGGYVSQIPQYYQKAYAGIYPIKQQPVIDEQKPYEQGRYS